MVVERGEIAAIAGEAAADHMLADYGAFYNMRRNMFRTMGDLQGKLWGKLGWSAGVAFYNYRIGSVELEKLRRRITTLESENAGQNARPTETNPKEDPSPTESHRSANDNAYRKDAEGFFI